ncbi:translation initiation factor eif-2b subunit alpha [Nannochloropsis oceanica]
MEAGQSPPVPPSAPTAPAVPPISPPSTDDPLIAIFRAKLKAEVPVPIAGVQTLLHVMSNSRAVTIMGIQNDLQEATKKLIDYERQMSRGRASISFRAGVELFFRYATRNNDDVPDFNALNQLFITRGNRFVSNALKSREVIAELGHNFVQDGMVILMHGRSEVVTGVLTRAAQNNKNFTVMITEGRPEGSGFKAAERLTEVGIPVTVILDSAAGYFMERVDIVLLGAEGVVESGGIVNKIGTCQIAMVAKLYNKPLYVAAESYKFARLYPLTQADLEENIDNDLNRPLVPPMQSDSSGTSSSSSSSCSSSNSSSALRSSVVVGDGGNVGFESGSVAGVAAMVTTQNPSCDYTPATYISLLFTDLGILTPAAVSDELIKLYQ